MWSWSDDNVPNDDAVSTYCNNEIALIKKDLACLIALGQISKTNL